MISFRVYIKYKEEESAHAHTHAEREKQRKKEKEKGCALSLLFFVKKREPRNTIAALFLM